jgi:AraC family transcriptional regulator
MRSGYASGRRGSGARPGRSRFNVTVAESLSARLLLDSPLVCVWDAVCREPRAGYGELKAASAAQIGLLRRGVFVVERWGQPVVVDTNTVLALGIGDEYRVGHPTSEGDEGIVLVVPPDVLEAAVGEAGRVGWLRPIDHFAICLLTRALHRDDEMLAAEETALLLLASLARSFAHPLSENRRLGRTQRLRVEQARTLLASSPRTRWDLDGLGRALGCSPFHLARQFRMLTGETISRYLLRLRLAIAVERLARGERDISALAIGTGFSHHSHLSARFRNTFGITPSRAREILTSEKVAELRALIDADELSRH